MRLDICNFEADKSGNIPIMIQLQKYAWLIETIRRAGMISYKDLSLRWMHNKDMRLYGLDRIENIEDTGETFEMPKEFVASEYFAKYYGVVTDKSVEPERIVVRAYGDHKEYMKSLPLHHSQSLIEDHGEYADFELYLAPTYDFIMKLLQMAAMIEVVSPKELRAEMRAWIEEMYELYKDDNK